MGAGNLSEILRAVTAKSNNCSMAPQIRHLHPWKVSRNEAVAIQEKLLPRVLVQPLHVQVRLVAGVDVAYSKMGRCLFGAIVILELGTMKTIETVTARGEALFPYIPGLLSFREIPVLLETVPRLCHLPDVFILDGQGIAHPRGLGIASHFGVLIDLPAVGCAKTHLVGDHQPVLRKKGSYKYLYRNNQKIGACLCTKDGVKPVFVSPGHRMDVDSSVTVVLQCCGDYRLPEPVRRAHLLATRLRDEKLKD